MRKSTFAVLALIGVQPAYAACNFGPSIYAESTPKAEIIECLEALRSNVSLLERKLALQEVIIGNAELRESSLKKDIERLQSQMLDLRFQDAGRRPAKSAPRK